MTTTIRDENYVDWWRQKFAANPDALFRMAGEIVGSAPDVKKLASNECAECGAELPKGWSRSFCSDRCRRRAWYRTPAGIEQKAKASEQRKGRYDALTSAGLPGREARLISCSPSRTVETLRRLMGGAA